MLEPAVEEPMIDGAPALFALGSWAIFGLKVDGLMIDGMLALFALGSWAISGLKVEGLMIDGKPALFALGSSAISGLEVESMDMCGVRKVVIARLSLSEFGSLPNLILRKSDPLSGFFELDDVEP